MKIKTRELVSGWTHLIAAVAAVFGLVGLLAAGWGDWPKFFAMLVYGISLVGMFAASATYHLGQGLSSRTVLILRKIDHSAIYLLIAGSYTPICTHFFTGFYRWGLAGVVWTLALVGIGVKVFVINAPRWVTAGIYLVMGWLAVLAVRQMFLYMPTGALLWLFLGGVFYTVGAVVYITRRPALFPEVFGFHELWHIFVILGALSHFIVVAAYVAPRLPL